MTPPPTPAWLKALQDLEARAATATPAEIAFTVHQIQADADRWLAEQGDDPVAHLARGELHRRLAALQADQVYMGRQFAAAWRTTRAALARWPRDPQLETLFLRIMQAADGLPAGAKNEYRGGVANAASQLAEELPMDPFSDDSELLTAHSQFMTDLGRACTREGRYDDAIRILEQVAAETARLPDLAGTEPGALTAMTHLHLALARTYYLAGVPDLFTARLELAGRARDRHLGLNSAVHLHSTAGLLALFVMRSIGTDDASKSMPPEASERFLEIIRTCRARLAELDVAPEVLADCDADIREIRRIRAGGLPPSRGGGAPQGSAPGFLPDDDFLFMAKFATEIEEDVHVPDWMHELDELAKVRPTPQERGKRQALLSRLKKKADRWLQERPRSYQRLAVLAEFQWKVEASWVGYDQYPFLQAGIVIDSLTTLSSAPRDIKASDAMRGAIDSGLASAPQYRSLFLDRLIDQAHKDERWAKSLYEESARLAADAHDAVAWLQLLLAIARRRLDRSFFTRALNLYPLVSQQAQRMIAAMPPPMRDGWGVSFKKIARERTQLMVAAHLGTGRTFLAMAMSTNALRALRAAESTLASGELPRSDHDRWSAELCTLTAQALARLGEEGSDTEARAYLQRGTDTLGRWNPEPDDLTGLAEALRGDLETARALLDDASSASPAQIDDDIEASFAALAADTGAAGTDARSDGPGKTGAQS